jgi:DNA-binding transcriptional regulator YiaG
MPNVASILKSEISRVARKEVKSETLVLKRAVAVYRSEIAAVKRRTQALEQQMKALSKGSLKASGAEDAQASSGGQRFSAKRLAAHRLRLGLSAGDFGRLIGVSAQSIYNWETGKARPRAAHMPAIAALRTLRRSGAAALLESLKES